MKLRLQANNKDRGFLGHVYSSKIRVQKSACMIHISTFFDMYLISNHGIYGQCHETITRICSFGYGINLSAPTR